jgi:hypothetical protein
MAKRAMSASMQPTQYKMGKTGLLASVRSVDEALIALVSGADIIDAKDPSQGALGALNTKEMSNIVKAVNGRCPISATTGDWYLGSAELLSSYEAVQNTGVDYIKIGLFGAHDESTLRAGLASLSSSRLTTIRSPHRIAVIMADHGVPLWPLSILKEQGFMGVMLDTANKHSGGLRTVASQETLSLFVAHAKNLGLMVGLAGSLSLEDIEALTALTPHYLGFRTALCGKEGRTGSLDSNRVAEIRSTLDRTNQNLPPHLPAN